MKYGPAEVQNPVNETLSRQLRYFLDGSNVLKLQQAFTEFHENLKLIIMSKLSFREGFILRIRFQNQTGDIRHGYQELHSIPDF